MARRPYHIKLQLLGVAFVAVSIVRCSGVATAETWSLERVLDVTRTRDPGVAAAAAAGDVGRSRAAESWAELLPSISLSAAVTRTDDPAALFSQKLRQGRFTAADFAIDQLNQPNPESALQWGLAVAQPLWNGGRELAAPGLASRRARAASAAQRDAVAQRLLSAVETYTAALRARGEDRASQQAKDAAAALRIAALERYRLGQVPELDTLRAAARNAEAGVREIGARRGLVAALERLSLLVEAPIQADALEIPADPPAIPDEAQGERGDLASARENASVAGTEAGIARRLRLLPSVNSRFSVDEYRPVSDGSGETRWMVEVFAAFPIFDGGLRRNEWRAARASADEASARAASLQRDIAAAVAAARVEDAVSRERREAARAGRAAAEEALRLASMRYRSGLIPLSEVLATDSEASDARAAEVDASAALLLAHYRLLRELGELQ